MSIATGSYGLNHGNAFAGMVADGQLSNIVSKLNSSAVIIPFGKAVFRDGETAAQLPTATSTAVQFVGVAVRELNRSYHTDDAFGAVPAKDFSVLTTGAIWVTVADAVVVGADVFVRVGATGQGDFSSAVGADATLGVQISGAKFLTSAAAGSLAKVSFVIGG